MRILLDESLPRQFAQELSGHDVQTVQKRGWAVLKNGELLRVASTEFQAFVSGDQNIEYQQNLHALPSAVRLVTIVTSKLARRFAEEWIAAWNARDLDRILSHYTDDFEMSSPVIVELMGEPTGTLKGKGAVRDYWAKALARLPDLHFELLDVYVGAASAVIHYRGPRGPSAEVFWFNSESKVYRAAAHYVKG